MQQAALLEGQRVLRAEMAVALAEKEFQLQALSDRGGSELLNQQQENARALAETLEAKSQTRSDITRRASQDPSSLFASVTTPPALCQDSLYKVFCIAVELLT